jgi:tetratricopeptide (TPR) repeat protein
MRTLNKAQIFVLLGAFLLFVLLFLVPRAPSEARKTASFNEMGIEPEKVDSIEAKAMLYNAYVESALAKMRDQNNTAEEQTKYRGEFMEWVLKLRDFSDSHPDNVTALLYVAHYNVQSNQLDKAIPRYLRAIELTKNDLKVHLAARITLSDVYLNVGETQLALEQLDASQKVAIANEKTEGKHYLGSIEKRILDIKNNIKN